MKTSSNSNQRRAAKLSAEIRTQPRRMSSASYRFASFCCVALRSVSHCAINRSQRARGSSNVSEELPNELLTLPLSSGSQLGDAKCVVSLCGQFAAVEQVFSRLGICISPNSFARALELLVSSKPSRGLEPRIASPSLQRGSYLPSSSSDALRRPKMSNRCASRTSLLDRARA